MACWWRCRQANPEAMNMGELSLLLICHVMAWVGERWSPLPTVINT